MGTLVILCLLIALLLAVRHVRLMAEYIQELQPLPHNEHEPILQTYYNKQVTIHTDHSPHKGLLLKADPYGIVLLMTAKNDSLERYFPRSSILFIDRKNK